MIEINYTWSTFAGGSTGGLDAVQIPDGVLYSAMYVENSTLATTNSFEFQTAQNSTGPWFTEASTAVAGSATVKGQAALRLTGPYLWARPAFKTGSTGTYTIRLIGAS